MRLVRNLIDKHCLLLRKNPHMFYLISYMIKLAASATTEMSVSITFHQPYLIISAIFFSQCGWTAFTTLASAFTPNHVRTLNNQYIRVRRKWLRLRIKSYGLNGNFPLIKSNYRISARSAKAVRATRLKHRLYRQRDNIIIHTYRNRILMQKVWKHRPAGITIAKVVE